MSYVTIEFQDFDGRDHWVDVEYEIHPYRPATKDSPADGGVEIYRVICDTFQLSPEQTQECERLAIDKIYGV